MSFLLPFSPALPATWSLPINRLPLLLLSAVLICAPALLPGQAMARDGAGPMALTGTVLTSSQDHLLLFTDLSSPITYDQLEGLHNGVESTLIFTLELKRLQPGSTPQLLTSRQISHTLSYDPLRREYRLLDSERPAQTAIYSSREQAVTATARLSDIKVIELDQLNSPQRYRLRLKAEHAPRRLPMSLHVLTGLLRPIGDPLKLKMDLCADLGPVHLHRSLRKEHPGLAGIVVREELQAALDLRKLFGYQKPVLETPL